MRIYRKGDIVDIKVGFYIFLIQACEVYQHLCLKTCFVSSLVIYTISWKGEIDGDPDIV